MKKLKILGLLFILFSIFSFSYAQEGTIIWSKDIGPYWSLSIPNAPIIDADESGVSILGSDTLLISNLQRMDLNGNVLWNKNPIHPSSTTLLDLDSDSTGIYTYSSDYVIGTIQKLNKANGAVLWTINVPSISGKIYFYNGNIYLVGGVTSASPSLYFAKLDASTGAILWNQVENNVGTEVAETPYGLIVDSTGMYVGIQETFDGTNNRNRFQKRDINNGNLVWTNLRPCCSFSESSLGLHGGYLYATSSENVASALKSPTTKFKFDFTSGALISKIDLVNSAWMPPVAKFVDNYYYLPSDTSELFIYSGTGMMYKYDTATDAIISIRGAIPGYASNNFDFQDGYMYIAGGTSSVTWAIEKRETSHLVVSNDLDKGLKIKANNKIYNIAIENSLSSALRISNGAQIYGVDLVPVNDASASPIRIQTSGGIKALKEYDGSSASSNPCVHHMWYPDPYFISTGLTFTQYNNCGATNPGVAGTQPPFSTCPALHLVKEDGTKLYQNNIMKGNVLKGLKSIRYDYFRDEIELSDTILIDEKTASDETYLSSLKLIGYKTSKDNVLVDQNFEPVGYNKQDLIQVENNHYNDTYFEYDNIKLPGPNQHYLYLNGGVTDYWVDKLRNNVLPKLAHPKLYSMIDLIDVNKDAAFYGDIQIYVKKYNLYWEKYDLEETFALENDESGLIKLPLGVSQVRVRYIDNVYDFNEIALLSDLDVDTDITKKVFDIKLDNTITIDKNNPLEIKVSDILTKQDLETYNNFYIETDGYYLYYVNDMENMDVGLKEELRIIGHLRDISRWMQDPDKYIDEIIDFLNN